MLIRKMKNSGIEWIGEIPEDWDVVQVKHLFEIGRGRVISKEELKFDSQTGYPVYSSQTKNDGVLGFIGTYDFDQPQLTWTTDGANAGTVFLRKGKYNCTNVCGTLKLKSDIQDKISLDYVYHALYVGAPYYKRKDTNGYKIMNNEMAVIKISLPSFDIQKKISKEIEGKIKTINNLIIKTEQSIEELKKYKQSLIKEAVTKGLDPNVEMKDSGIEWIGRIPKNWIVIKINRLFNYFGSGTTPQSGNSIYHENGEIPWLNTGDLKDSKNIEISKKVTKKAIMDYSALKIHPKGSIVVAMYGATIGKIGITNIEFTTNQACCVLNEPNINTDIQFVFYFLLGFKNQLIEQAKGAGQPNISQETLKQFRVSLPTQSEQRQIVSYLDEQTSRIDKLIADKTKVIEELEDYKKSLIYEYVTGKKEV